jgi:hypothetical protein
MGFPERNISKRAELRTSIGLSGSGLGWRRRWAAWRRECDENPLTSANRYDRPIDDIAISFRAGHF